MFWFNGFGDCESLQSLFEEVFFLFWVFSLTLGCGQSSSFQQDILLKTINPRSRINRSDLISDDFFCDYVCLVFD